MEETVDNQSAASCFDVFHHETCKKISSQAQLIMSLYDRISVLESTVAVSRLVPDDASPAKDNDILLLKEAKDNEIFLLKEQFAQREAEREQQLDELTRLLLEQCEQKAEEEDELHSLVMEKHELLLTLGQTLTSQQERIRELEMALCSHTTGEEKHHLLLSSLSPEKHSTAIVIDQQEVVELQTALAEMQAKLHQAQEAAENRENFLCEQIDMLRSVLELTEEWEIKRDNSSTGNHRIFFYNNKTNECQWEIPTTTITTTTTQEYIRSCTTTQPTTSGTGDNKVVEQQPLHENQRPSMTQPSLPDNWIAMEDISSHTTYYYNKISGKSQWELPLPSPAPVVKSIGNFFRPNKYKR